MLGPAEQVKRESVMPPTFVKLSLYFLGLGLEQTLFQTTSSFPGSSWAMLVPQPSVCLLRFVPAPLCSPSRLLLHSPQQRDFPSLGIPPHLVVPCGDREGGLSCLLGDYGWFGKDAAVPRVSGSLPLPV